MRLSVGLSVAAVVLVVFGLLAGLLYSLQHNSELARLEQEHSLALGRLEGKIEEMDKNHALELANLRAELAEAKAIVYDLSKRLARVER